MICPTCGSNIPDGSTMCPTCGAQLSQPTPEPATQLLDPQPTPVAPTPVQPTPVQPTPVQPMGQQFNQQTTGQQFNQQPMGQQFNQQPMRQQFNQPAYAQVPPAKKSNTGLIVGLIIGALALIAGIVLLLVLVVFKDDDKDEKTTQATTTQAVITTTEATTTSATTAPTTTEYYEPNPTSDYSVIDDGTYMIDSISLEDQYYYGNDLDSMGYGNVKMVVDGDIIHFYSDEGVLPVDYNYTLDEYGWGEIYNSAETYDLYYYKELGILTIDFASSPEFSEYSVYQMDFAK